MKTYRIKISKGFNEIGIRPDDIPTRNSGLLVEARQVRVTRAGMEGYTPDVNDILLTGKTGDTTYESVYPPEHNATYVKATTDNGAGYYPFYATDPTKSVTGTQVGNAWASQYGPGGNTNKAFHIDLGNAVIVQRIYYENYHESGDYETAGACDFTFWGSNDADAFANTAYTADNNWTQLTTSSTQFARHPHADIADPNYITVTNSTAYRYYRIKISNNWGYSWQMGLRRIELQVESARRFYDSITSNQVTISRRWPFPQVFLTDVGVFVGALEGLYKVIDPSPDQYPNVVLQSYSTGSTVWPWICIPIPGYPAFTSGTKFVYYDSNASAYIVVT